MHRTFATAALLVTTAMYPTFAFAQGVVPTAAAEYESIPLADVPAGTVGEGAGDIDLTTSGFPSVGNQGGVSSCATWAIAAAWSYQLRRARGQTGLYLSPMYLYARTRGEGDLSCNRGTAIPTAMRVLRNEGAPPTSAWPTPVCDLNVTDDDVARARAYRSGGFARVNFNDGLALRSFLADGQPVVLSLRSTDHFEQYRASYYDVWRGNLTGYHAVVLIGYHAASGAWLVQNSWGSDWGAQGRVWISDQAFRSMVSEAYVIRMPRVTNCPGNSSWNGSECICPTATTWSAERQLCVTNAVVTSSGLDISGSESNFGEHSVNAGWQRDMTVSAGGNLNSGALVLGDHHGVGWITARPDLLVNLSGAASSVVVTAAARQGEDITLIVYTPDGRWFVNDDSPGSLQPRVVIPAAAAGRYRVWVGTYAPSGEYFPSSTVRFAAME